MGGASRRIYPTANTTAQWYETLFSRGTFSRIDKILLHTTETTGWPGYKGGASAPTLTYHPRLRAWRQHNFIDTSARALVDPTSTPVRENRDNVIQIEIVCYSDERVAASVDGLPVSGLTDAHYQDLADFVRWVRQEWGGPPLVAPKFLPYPQSYGNSAVRMSGSEYDAFRGILGHQHASGNDHGDPSNIDAAKIIRLAGGTAPTVTSPEEDDMQLTDRVKLIPGNGVEYSTPDTTVEGILASTNNAALAALAKVTALSAAVAALATTQGLDPAKVEEILTAAVDKALADLRISRQGA